MNDPPSKLNDDDDDDLESPFDNIPTPRPLYKRLCLDKQMEELLSPGFVSTEDSSLFPVCRTSSSSSSHLGKSTPEFKATTSSAPGAPTGPQIANIFDTPAASNHLSPPPPLAVGETVEGHHAVVRTPLKEFNADCCSSSPGASSWTPLPNYGSMVTPELRVMVAQCTCVTSLIFGLCCGFLL